MDISICSYATQDAFAEQQQTVNQASASEQQPPAATGSGASPKPPAKPAGLENSSNDQKGEDSIVVNSSSSNVNNDSRTTSNSTNGTRVDPGLSSATKLRDLTSKAAGSLQANSAATEASEQKHPVAAYAVNQTAEVQSAMKHSGGDQGYAKSVSSRSIDGDDDGMLDRFGSVDIITGKPVRDLKLDPVLQLVKWRESLFGSRDSVSESLDRDENTD